MSKSAIDDSMLYATRLASAQLIFEEEFKLASLCKDVELLRTGGHMASPEIEAEFVEAVTSYFQKNGSFRTEVEHVPEAKSLIRWCQIKLKDD